MISLLLILIDTNRIPIDLLEAESEFNWWLSVVKFMRMSSQ